MFKFFQKIRKQLLSQSRLSRYFIYAIGEIVLVVIGILIAIQINNWNRERKLYGEELENYQLIVADLKRDLTLFGLYKDLYSSYLDTYFEINNIIKGQGSLENIFPDHIVMNAEFNPVTQKNHQSNIEKFRNGEIREQINNYFRRLSQVTQATTEFNKLIVQESRPFLLKESNVFDNDKVFDNEDRTFPPFKGVATVDTVKLKEVFNHKYFLPILSQLRMSMGFYVASLERSIEENQILIQDLEASLE